MIRNFKQRHILFPIKRHTPRRGFISAKNAENISKPLETLSLTNKFIKVTNFSMDVQSAEDGSFLKQSLATTFSLIALKVVFSVRNAEKFFDVKMIFVIIWPSTMTWNTKSVINAEKHSARLRG